MLFLKPSLGQCLIWQIIVLQYGGPDMPAKLERRSIHLHRLLLLPRDLSRTYNALSIPKGRRLPLVIPRIFIQCRLAGGKDLQLTILSAPEVAIIATIIPAMDYATALENGKWLPFFTTGAVSIKVIRLRRDWNPPRKRWSYYTITIGADRISLQVSGLARA